MHVCIMYNKIKKSYKTNTLCDNLILVVA